MRKLRDSRLTTAIGEDTWKGPFSSHAGNVNDTAFSFSEVRQNQLRQVEGSPDVYVHHIVPVFESRVLDCAFGDDACCVD